jgi:Malectin domain
VRLGATLLLLALPAFGQTIAPTITPNPVMLGGSAVIALNYTDRVPTANIASLQWQFTLPPGVTLGTPTLGSAVPSGTKAVSCGAAICLAAGPNAILLTTGVIATIPISIANNAQAGPVLPTVIAASAAGLNVPVIVGTTFIQVATASSVVIQCGSPTDKYFVGGVPDPSNPASKPWPMPLPAPLAFLRYSQPGSPISYNIPVTNGAYAVNVTLAEPNKTGPGQRIFTITVNGQTTDPIDIYAATGGQNIPFVVPLLPVVSAGYVRLQFTAIAGNAVVSEISVTPLAFAWTNCVAAPAPSPSCATLSLVRVVRDDGSSLMMWAFQAPNVPLSARWQSARTP